MGYQYRHEGGGLALRLELDQTTVEAPCPTCQELDRDGVISVVVDAEQTQGTFLGRCQHGHSSMVSWTREG